ncbi:MAG: NAD(P)H-hydrate dehydratase [Candidatus Pacebacteria bacterium]|nr:NAD(P)H-hydrate dehydratase [Candidatus Paceibacterota bacterium]PIR59730.1 MAG: NAD(P)H-hydrate dehydratase [Candidatus Pacebacteria bacterium CG10_big_fil_rev_8_21_14_0_10_45_6]
MTLSPSISQHLQKITLPDGNSHKGQNGKLLVIGGSELFHAASKWSLDIASKFVDMVFYASVPSNNELVREAKGAFWNGIVLERDEIPNYITEADCILIGPGMDRSAETKELVTKLVADFPDRRWVIDAGALQTIEPTQFPDGSILTPHQGEYDRIFNLLGGSMDNLLARGITVLLKGPSDYVYHRAAVTTITGGNPGMTKGGTGDVLAGLVAALYCKQEAETAAVVGSFINKQTGEYLAEKVGPFFNSSDLAGAIPEVFWRVLREVTAV